MILVVGSTGVLGGQIARGLLDKGRRVRILVRPASNHQPLVREGALPSYGDLTDRPRQVLVVHGVERDLQVMRKRNEPTTHQLDELRLRCDRHGICLPRVGGASKSAS